MKLAAIYNVWDGDELLPGSIDCIYDHVDKIIIVYQVYSNYGEDYAPNLSMYSNDDKIHCILFNPVATSRGSVNETNKRNIGIGIARTWGCTHFLHMDCDEYYLDFADAKQKYIESGKAGSVCKVQTYFKKPTWAFENLDGYYVPFIHELKPHTQAGASEYPFYVDPTRRINEWVVAMLPVTMHHFSWVRLDIERKCRNSSAKRNIERGTMLQDYHSPDIGPGFCVKDYGMKLIEVNDNFNLSGIFA